MNNCSKCKESKESSEFGLDPRNKSGLKSNCKKCGRASAKANYSTHREKNIQRSREWREKNRVEYNKRRRMKRAETRVKSASTKYGITTEEVKLLLSRTHCQICRREISYDKENRHEWPNIDHCHLTNKVRGTLCGYCNNLLGRAKDDIDILESAISYLIINK